MTFLRDFFPRLIAGSTGKKIWGNQIFLHLFPPFFHFYWESKHQKPIRNLRVFPSPSLPSAFIEGVFGHIWGLHRMSSGNFTQDCDELFALLKYNDFFDLGFAHDCQGKKSFLDVNLSMFLANYTLCTLTPQNFLFFKTLQNISKCFQIFPAVRKFPADFFQALLG